MIQEGTFNPLVAGPIPARPTKLNQGVGCLSHPVFFFPNPGRYPAETTGGFCSRPPPYRDRATPVLINLSFQRKPMRNLFGALCLIQQRHGGPEAEEVALKTESDDLPLGQWRDD